jgi:hypothetical protein
MCASGVLRERRDGTGLRCTGGGVVLDLLVGAEIEDVGAGITMIEHVLRYSVWCR